MSIHAMTTAAVGFRKAPRTTGGILRGVSDAEKTGANQPQTPLATALEAIVAYIPTEIVTTYVAVLAAINDGGRSQSGQWVAFWAFAVVTPVTVWIVFATKIRAAGEPLPLTPTAWPMWELAAASIAFVAWAYALPESPFSSFTWYRPALATVVILVVTFALGLVAPLFQPRAPTR